MGKFEGEDRHEVIDGEGRTKFLRKARMQGSRCGGFMYTILMIRKSGRMMIRYYSC